VIWAIVLLGALLVVAAVGAVARPAKAVVALLGTGAVVFVLFLTLAITNSAGGATGTPSRITSRGAWSIVNLPPSKLAGPRVFPPRERRSRASTRTTSSRGLNGFVT